MRVPVRRRVRAGAITLIALTTLAVSACAPPPEGGPADVPDAATLFEGGSFPVEIVVEPQTVTTEFSLFGMATCTSTSVTPSVDLRGALTVAPAELDPDLTRVTIPGATLELPDATVSAGSLSLSCNGAHLGTIGVSLQFDALASVQSVVLDTGTGTLTLTDPTITLTDVRATFAGGPPGAAPMPLEPVTVTVPTIDVPV
jgi:hypothetical protein